VARDEPSPPRSGMLKTLGVDPVTRLGVERKIQKPGHVGGLTLDIAAAAALLLARTHLDAVGQKLSEAVGLEFLEGQPLG
jgi:hypothetical protein